MEPPTRELPSRPISFPIFPPLSTEQIFTPLAVPQTISLPIPQPGGDKLGIKRPKIKPGQVLPLETDFETLNAIRTSRHKIERVNSGATFQPYNQPLTVGQAGLILKPKSGPASISQVAKPSPQTQPAVQFVLLQPQKKGA